MNLNEVSGKVLIFNYQVARNLSMMTSFYCTKKCIASFLFPQFSPALLVQLCLGRAYI